MSALLPLALALLLLAPGRTARRILGSREDDLALDLAAGLVVLHLLLLVTSLAGIPWRWLTPALAACLLALAWPRGVPVGPARRRSRIGVGDLVAAGAVGFFATLTAGSWLTTPDYIYHWGAKARHFALADGIDWYYLAASHNWRIHPDYPNLWPEIVAISARLLGSSDSPVLLLWSPLLVGVLLLTARRTLDQVAHRASQPAMAALALALVGFAVGHEMAGAADWLIALAGALAVPALLAPRDLEGDARIAVAAALAASSKIEGVPFAVCLVAAHLVGRGEGRFRLPSWQSLVRIGLPIAAVLVPWLVQAWRLHLFRPTNAGGFDAARGAAIWPAVFQVARLPAWQGLPFALALLPLGLFAARHRRLAVALLAQLTFYLWVYYTGPVDTRFYVLSSLPRLLLHLIPAAAIGLATALPAARSAADEVSA